VDAIHCIVTVGWSFTLKSTCSSLAREARHDPSGLTSKSVRWPRQRMVKIAGASFPTGWEEVVAVIMGL
jgi:hypothetical protein